MTSSPVVRSDPSLCGSLYGNVIRSVVRFTAFAGSKTFFITSAFEALFASDLAISETLDPGAETAAVSFRYDADSVTTTRMAREPAKLTLDASPTPAVAVAA